MKYTQIVFLLLFLSRINTRIVFPLFLFVLLLIFCWLSFPLRWLFDYLLIFINNYQQLEMIFVPCIWHL